MVNRTSAMHGDNHWHRKCAAFELSGKTGVWRDLPVRPEVQETGRAKTWVLQGRNSRGWYGGVALRRLVTSRKGRFEWRNPEGNPYIPRDEIRRTIESRYADVAFALSNT